MSLPLLLRPTLGPPDLLLRSRAACRWMSLGALALLSAGAQAGPSKLAPCDAAVDAQVRLAWHAVAVQPGKEDVPPMLGEVRWRAQAVPGRLLDLGPKVEVLDVSWQGGLGPSRPNLRQAARSAGCLVTAPPVPLQWEVRTGQDGRQLSWAAPLGDGQGRVIIRYLARADGALAHDRSSGWWATQWSCESWVPCLKSPGARPTWSLTLLPPAGVAAIQTEGSMPGHAATAAGREQAGVPGYLMGFVAGQGRHVVRQTPHGRWAAIGAETLSPEVLDKALLRQQQWVDVMARRAGMPWPHASFVVAYLPMPAAQELNGVILLSAREAEAAADPAKVPWTTVHELAHQWWGNGVTNASWQDMWMNEGLATYLTQDTIRQVAGDAAADEHLGLALARWQSLVQRGRDKPLHFPSWESPTRDDRQVVYDKGSWFFETLRRTMGDVAFHAALKAYTRRHWGQAVQPDDLLTVLQAHTDRPLAPLFDAWVWGRGEPPVPPASLAAWRS